MRTFNTQAAQGDLLIRRVDNLSDDLTEMKPENGGFVVAHSETGHHHVIEAKPNVKAWTTDDPFIMNLMVGAGEPVVLEHHRDFDTHEPITIPPGKYEIRRQREYTPEGYRRVED